MTFLSDAGGHLDLGINLEWPNGGGALIDAVLYSQVIDLLVYYFYGSAQFNSLLRELCD